MLKTVFAYDTKSFKAKTVLIDPEAVKKTNTGCRNNTIAHECVHWYKHRYYYKMQKFSLPRYAKYCKCRVDQLPESTDEENIMESQAIGIAPRILMPKNTFVEAAEHLGVAYGKDNRSAICTLADFFDVSKQSVEIRLEELRSISIAHCLICDFCGLLAVRDVLGIFWSSAFF